MEFQYTQKAWYKLYEEGVSKKEVEECIFKGGKQFQPDGTILSKRGYLTVVYKKKTNRIVVISLWAGDKEYKVTR